MSFENFPYSNFHELNLDWIVQKIKEAYSPDNPPENIVLSINGQTGHVELFTDNLIRLPDVPDNVWNIYRVADDEAKGIQFDDDGAYRIYRDQRYKIYDEDNEPDYPVTSVNGQTGDVQIAIPSALVRSVNGKTGAVITPFTNPNGDILSLDTNSPGNRWGFSRQTSAGNASIYVDTSGNTIKAYVSLAPAGGGSARTFPLLTSADIPESAGVVSINTKTGVVTIYGSDIITTQNGNTTIAQDISSLQSGLNTEVSDRNNAIQDLSSRLNAEIADRQTEDAGIENRLGGAITTETSERTSADNAINESINTIEDEIDTLDSDVTDLKSALSSLEDTVYGAKTPLTIDDINNGYWSTNTYTNTTSWKYGFVDVGTNSVAIVDIKNTTNQSVNIQVLDSNKNYVRLIGNWLTQGEYTITLGASEKYLRISAKPAEISNIPVYKSTTVPLQNQVDELRAEIEGIDTTTSITKITMSEVVTLPARFPDTDTDSRIKATSECMLMELSRPGAQHSDWTIETFDGYLTIAGTIRGLTDITLYLI